MYIRVSSSLHTGKGAFTSYIAKCSSGANEDGFFLPESIFAGTLLCEDNQVASVFQMIRSLF